LGIRKQSIYQATEKLLVPNKICIGIPKMHLNNLDAEKKLNSGQNKKKLIVYLQTLKIKGKNQIMAKEKNDYIICLIGFQTDTFI